MGTFVPILALLAVVAMGLLVTRVGTVALMFTGLSHELARFQALSAFMGVGFTTTESEQVLGHPVRRRIIRWLMLLGNAGFVAAVSSLLPVFLTHEQGSMGFLARILWLASGLTLMWAISASSWVDAQLSRAIGWALKHWTRLEVWDYSGLLQLGQGYTVSELFVEPENWVAGKNLADIRLSDEGVQVLAIRRVDGEFIGAPTGRTYIRKRDTLITYGLVEHLVELERRHADANGDMAHQRRVLEQSMVVQQQEQHDRDRLQAGGTVSGTHNTMK